ncbi:MAG: hypothetical protein OXE84_10445, partial [Rhodobacteraceae bacterium]|nr:hypothetical protein [Paracoccaceae bacterium]
FDPCALFQGMEEARDAPAQFVPVQDGGCTVEIGRIPVRRLRGEGQHPPLPRILILFVANSQLD